MLPNINANINTTNATLKSVIKNREDIKMAKKEYHNL